MEELNNKLIKAKVTSMGRSEENCNLTVKEQNIQELQHRLHVVKVIFLGYIHCYLNLLVYQDNIN